MTKPVRCFPADDPWIYRFEATHPPLSWNPGLVNRVPHVIQQRFVSFLSTGEWTYKSLDT